MGRRGSEIGPVLTPITCQLGVVVRTTQGSQAGVHATIVGNEGSDRPKLRYDNGQEVSIDAWRCQVVLSLLTPEHRRKIKVANERMERNQRLWEDKRMKEKQERARQARISNLQKERAASARWNF